MLSVTSTGTFLPPTQLPVNKPKLARFSNVYDSFSTACLKICLHRVTFLPFSAFISPSISRQGALTQLLISEQQWAGGDRFAKTNNLISGSTALISSAQNSLEKWVRNNITSTAITSWLDLDFTFKGEGTVVVAEVYWSVYDIVGILLDVVSTSQLVYATVYIVITWCSWAFNNKACVVFEHVLSQTTLKFKSFPRAMICFNFVNLSDWGWMHLHWQPISSAEFCVYFCVYFCVRIHAQIVKEGKALCFLCTPGFLSVSKSATKESKHWGDWIKTLLHPYTPAHTCKYIPSLLRVFLFIPIYHELGIY